jgi:hypothetical protein
VVEVRVLKVFRVDKELKVFRVDKELKVFREH